MSRLLPPGRYGFADMKIGDWWETGGILVTESQIQAFAGVTGDFYDVHMDDDFAQELGFEGRIAHGLLVISLVDGLKNRATVQLEIIASLGWNIKFSKPVMIGDRISARLKIAGLRETSKAGRGIATLDVTVTNQHGIVVQSGENLSMMML